MPLYPSPPHLSPAPAVPVPPNAILIAATDNPQAAVDSHPEGTAFLLAAGVHHGFSVRPASRDSFFAQPATVLDGDNASPYAFYAFSSHTDPGAHFVTIQGSAPDQRLLIRNYTADHKNQVGAIHPQQDTEPELGRADHWSVQWVEVSNTWATGIIVGSNMTIRQCYIHDNGQLGVGGTGSGSVIDGNEIAGNNTRGVNPEFEAGGLKLAQVDVASITDNYVHDNHGPGLWDDIDSVNIVYAGNTVVHNDREGILHEIGHAAVIRDNTVSGNGLAKHNWMWGGGVVVSTSDNTQIYHNTLSANGNGITAVEQDRGSGPRGRYVLANLSVHDNVVSGGGAVGVAVDNGDQGVFDRHLTWARNVYRGSESFMWLNAVVSWKEWQALGQDAGGQWSPA